MHPPPFLSPDLPKLKAMLRDMILYFDFWNVSKLNSLLQQLIWKRLGYIALSSHFSHCCSISLWQLSHLVNFWTPVFWSHWVATDPLKLEKRASRVLGNRIIINKVRQHPAWLAGRSTSASTPTSTSTVISTSASTPVSTPTWTMTYPTFSSQVSLCLVNWSMLGREAIVRSNHSWLQDGDDEDEEEDDHHEDDCYREWLWQCWHISMFVL